MIHRAAECKAEVREKMRGGDGSVRIVHFFDENTELAAPTRLCARLELEPGSSIGFHRHDGEEEIFLVLAGRAEVDDDGVTAEVGPGDAILTGNAGHAVRSLGPGTLVMTALIVPFAK
ncbi:Oxalate-binding protein [bioreactor metagenome]|uniref:Oxalate-binding protein n=1 Tax=bioreactor metagenome TaxID=1076179 RepID=A0A645B0Z4_9ZZZZ